MNATSSSVVEIEGRGIPLRGNDIDTDRIIPARYLRSITFEGLGEHAFEDDRKEGGHPFDHSRYQGASILIANENFGCGSSREHAPQALMRWGIHALVGESFAEIFRGNCTAMGVPCVTAGSEAIGLLMEAIEADPAIEATLDLRSKTLTYGETVLPIDIPEGNRVQLLEGAWDATGMLLEAADEVRSVADRLPYIAGF
ncbi:MAG: 3-isopropylmalate dehydratase small subunit [Candidatus Latescibacteria bacterium]|jgi:3-isopropylmalate/(R)-2-methylmalate dehydratase small subunit|nr:3-isopropylmalate dehydratase small subunit [Candidatus Latescibacterota bacterium]